MCCCEHEEGKIHLHADVNTYLKDLKIPATFPQPITTENLMTPRRYSNASQTKYSILRTTSTSEAGVLIISMGTGKI
jgi:hypothetical protein